MRRAIGAMAMAGLLGAAWAAGALGAPAPTGIRVTGASGQDCEFTVIGQVRGARGGAVVFESLATGRPVVMGGGSLNGAGRFQVDAEGIGPRSDGCDVNAPVVAGRSSWWRVRYLGTPWARPAATGVFRSAACGTTPLFGRTGRPCRPGP